MKDIEKHAAVVIRQHQRRWGGHCSCGWQRDLMSSTDQSAHVALQLRGLLAETPPDRDG